MNELKELPIDSIKISKDRFRKDMGDIESLAASIEAVGQLVPIHVTASGHLIAGERRIRALQSINRTTVRAVVLDATDVDQKIYEIVENLERKDFTWQERVFAIQELHNMLKATRPKWSERKTAKEAGLSSGGVVTDLNLADALRENPELFEKCKTKESALKVLQRYNVDEAVSELKLRKSGTNYGKRAEQHVFLGDCTVLIDKLPDNVVNSVISDPFYGVDIETTKQVKHRDALDIYEDSEELYKDTMATLIKKLPRVLKKDASIVLFCAFQRAPWLIDRLHEVGIICDPRPAIWHKKNFLGQSNNPTIRFARCYEVFIYGFRGDTVLFKQGQPDVCHFPVVHPLDKEHPVQKPLELMEELVERFCMPGQTILDPFCGAGTTLLAAFKKGCNPIGFELDKRYHAIAVNNVSTALRLKDGGMLAHIGAKT